METASQKAAGGSSQRIPHAQHSPEIVPVVEERRHLEFDRSGMRVLLYMSYCLDFRIVYCINYNMALHAVGVSVSEMSLGLNQ